MKLRQMRTTQPGLALAVAAVAAVACNWTRPEDELTLGQSITILRELWAVTERIYPDDVAPCLLGGSALVPFTRSGQQRGDTTWTTAMATVTPDGCKLSADGDTLALEGDPSIVFELEGWRVDFKKGNNEFNMAITGAVTWSRTDGTSNSCGVDLTMEDGHMREEYGEIDGGLAGRLCGRDVSFHFSEIDWAVVE